MVPEVRENGEQTPNVDTSPEARRDRCGGVLSATPNPKWGGLSNFKNRSHWYEHLEDRLSQHAPSFTSMVAADADRRPAARDLPLLLSSPADATLQKLPTYVTSASLRVSSPANPAAGTTVMCSAVFTPIDWTQMVATSFFQGNPQPTQRNESMQSQQPNPVTIPSPNTPPHRPAQPGAKRGGCVKSVFVSR